jgi:hypothetical protein
MPPDLQSALVQVHWQHLQSASPLARAEYARSLQGLVSLEASAAAALDDGLDEARRLAERACAALVRWRAPWTRGLSAYLARLGQRDAAQVARGGNALQAAWVLANRKALLDGRMQPLGGLNLARLGWALHGADDAASRYALTLSVEPAPTPGVPGRPVLRLQALERLGPAIPRLADDLTSPLSRVTPDGPAGATQAPAWLALDVVQPLMAGVSTEIRNGARVLLLEPFTKPDWARALRFEHDRWQAQAADGRWLTWVPRRPVRLWDRGPTEVAWQLPHGAWWDAGPGFPMSPHVGVIGRPGWAVRLGLDEHGVWADFEVEGRRGTVLRPPKSKVDRCPDVPDLSSRLVRTAPSPTRDAAQTR